MKNSIYVLCLVVATASSMQAQVCQWVEAAGQITEVCGKVGIGTANPGNLLHVFDTSDGTISIFGHHAVTVETNPADGVQNDYAVWFGAHENVFAGVTNNGKLIGSRTDAFHVGSGWLADTIGATTFSGIWSGAPGEGATSTATVNTAFGHRVWIYKGLGTVNTGYGVWVSDVEATNGYAFYQVGANDKNYFAGNLGIGTAPTANALEVLGNANFQGTVTGTDIRANYQDVAEWVPAREELAAGTVVILDGTADNTVIRSKGAYDTTVAGVVSARPGIILGVPDAAKAQIATTGRVKVRVDATAAPIRRGDLLVTAGKPGMAMKSVPVEIGGVAMHRPGTLIGKALESLESGEGEILVLLSLQ